MKPHDARQFHVIPLSMQGEGDVYVVGNADIGDFYQIPAQGVDILRMIVAGSTPAAIKSRLAATEAGTVDVDGFIDQLLQIGFIIPDEDRHDAQPRPRHAADRKGRIFNVDQRIARMIFSPPMLVLYVAVIACATVMAIRNPALRIDGNAWFTETNKTPFLLLLILMSLAQTVIHESAHMLAAARHGIRSRYGIGNRLWTIVAESDLTGILSLPKSQRYLPMLAGLLSDALVIALLTIALGSLLDAGASPFVVQVTRAVVLEAAIGMAWQLNVFVKTDIYYVLCNFFSYPDLDRDARAYLRQLLHRATLGRFGRHADASAFSRPIVLLLFSSVWLLGRLLSLLILFVVVLPTIYRYVALAIRQLAAPVEGTWAAVDTLLYVLITASVLGAGIYMWLRPKFLSRST